MFKKIIILFFYFSSYTLASEEYFLTLRNDKVNLRQGPSFEYPIKILYKKKYLPVLVQDESGCSISAADFLTDRLLSLMNESESKNIVIIPI